MAQDDVGESYDTTGLLSDEQVRFLLPLLLLVLLLLRLLWFQWRKTAWASHSLRCV